MFSNENNAKRLFLFLIDKLHIYIKQMSLLQYPKCLLHYIAGLFLFVFTFSSLHTNADTIIAKEYYLKAAFLYNFARLIDWPDNAFKSTKSQIHLCLIGNNPFGQALKTINGKKVKDRELIIDTNISLQQIPQCQILFIGSDKKHTIEQILARSEHFPILTVSEKQGFTQQNGHVRFIVTRGETLSLEINLDSVNKANLKMSSRILTLATIVKSERDK